MARERIDYKWYERDELFARLRKERKAVVEDYSLSPFDDEGHHTINYCIIENNPPKSVFISYSSKDEAFVKKLTDHLKNAGVIVWLDKDEINIGIR